MTSLAINVAIAVAVWLAWARATIARYSVPRVPSAIAVSAAPSGIDPCGTYPDMTECSDVFTPGQ